MGDEHGPTRGARALFVRLLLLLAVKQRVPREEIVKRLLDMQFDAAAADGGGAGDVAGQIMTRMRGFLPGQ